MKYIRILVMLSVFAQAACVNTTYYKQYPDGTLAGCPDHSDPSCIAIKTDTTKNLIPIGIALLVVGGIALYEYLND